MGQAARLLRRTLGLGKGRSADDETTTGQDRNAGWWDFLEAALIRCANDLRGTLTVSEASYGLVAGVSHADARHYFIYGVLDEIQKAGVAIARWRELLSDAGSGDAEQDQVSRVVFESIGDEQSLWCRKLIEALVALICFGDTNADNYFRHYLLLEDLQGFLSTNQDLAAFYGHGSNNVHSSIERTREMLAEIEAADALDTAQMWYRATAFDSANPQVGRVMSSLRARLQRALQRATPAERITLGLSYEQFFSPASRDIHFRPTARFPQVSLAELHSRVSRCGMLALHSLVQCQNLLAVVPDGLCAQIKGVLDRNEQPTQLLQSTTKGRAALGDFVLAYGDLGEVVEIAESVFGYESYRVRYLAERPIPAVGEDWFIGRHIHRLFARADHLERLQEMEQDGRIPAGSTEMFTSLPQSQQAEAFRQSVIALWEGGLRDHVRRRRDPE